MNSIKWLMLLLTVYFSAEASAVDTEDCRAGKLYPVDAIKGYYYCVNDLKRYESCPAENTYFDATFSVCRHGNPPSSPPSSPSPSPSPSPEEIAVLTGKCQRIGLIGDLTDCSRFYHCDAKGVDMKSDKCPGNQIFDLNKLNCVSGTC